MNKFDNIVLLAGGDSTRFWPLSDKNLTPFLGKPLLTHQVDRLKNYTDRIYIVGSTKQNLDLLRKQAIIVEQKNADIGQGGAILSLKNKIKGSALILNASDILDFSTFEKFDQTKDYVLLGKKMTNYFNGGYVRFDGEKPVEVIEKPAPEKVPSNIVKLVGDYIKDINGFIEVLENTKTEKDDLYEKALSVLLKQRANTSCVTYDNYWYPLKYPWQVLPLMHYFLSSQLKSFKDRSTIVSRRAVITGDVYLGKNVRVGDFAKVVGPCYIGENTVIGDYSLVRSSHIGNNCLVGGYSEITRSYLGSGVMLHRDYIGDSVLAQRVLIGSGTTTANFRFNGKSVHSIVKDNRVDTGLPKLGTMIGKNTKIGVNTTILPGIKIGQNSYIGPHSLITEDVEDQIFVFKDTKTKNSEK